MDEFLIQTVAIPRAPLESPGSGDARRADARTTHGLRASVEAHPHPAAAPRRVDARRRGCRRGNVSPRSAARRVALSGTLAAGRAERRPASEAAEATGHASTRRDCCHGL